MADTLSPSNFPQSFDDWIVTNGDKVQFVHGLAIELGIQHLLGFGWVHGCSSMISGDTSTGAGAGLLMESGDTKIIPFRPLPYCRTVELWTLLGGHENKQCKLTASVADYGGTTLSYEKIFTGGDESYVLNNTNWETVSWDAPYEFELGDGKSTMWTDKADSGFNITLTNSGDDNVYLYSYAIRQKHNSILSQ